MIATVMEVKVEDDSGGTRDDSGVTLIELIVGILVSTVVLMGVSSILIGAWLTQSDVISTSEATNRGQLVSSAVEKAMRNGLYFDVSAGGTVLMIETTLNGQLKCQAFRLDEEVAQLKTAESGLPSAPWGTWLAEDADRGWQALVGQSGSTSFFVATGETLTYTFDIETESAPVQFRGEASLRWVESGSPSCW
ncbi:prepilin-type N-terminal cleavage/methylation domain-containing protein [uncultured Microbacterium sp.]|uniref:prepilin-type N-terminal cleavage/methylation domain-containing protein n=1 Tax=uncultured Microbacterium sp. TaxID=191216 RepID=UPI0028D50F81|nr:prepilin-type N-terminal cleavage/methylation domain-containing protein [uncultured Microbacterium sp.]